jgi:hypothetical protein
MTTYAFVDTYAHTVTYVTDKLLLCVKEIIRESGLDPAKMTRDWIVLERGVSAWIRSKHLEKIVLEIFDPRTGDPIGRWDLGIVYGYSGGDGSLWVDTDVIRYNIRKAGLIPSSCDYEIIVTTKANRPAIDGWYTCQLRSTDGLTRYSIGTTIGGSGLGAQVAYWGRK